MADETKHVRRIVTDSYRALLPRKAMIELQKLAGDSQPDALVRFSGGENHFLLKCERLLLSHKDAQLLLSHYF